MMMLRTHERSLAKVCVGIVLFAAALWCLVTAARTPAKPLPKNVDYRHVHEPVAKLLFSGKYQEAHDWAASFCQANPQDAEGWYFLAGAQANLGQLDAAQRSVVHAVQAGLDPMRLVAGPRDVFRPLVESKPFQDYLAGRGRLILHGPMVGDVRATSAKVWVRTADTDSVQVQVKSVSGGPAKVFGPVMATSASDYTAVVELKGLPVQTSYAYTVIAHGPDGQTDRASGSFRTRPPKGAPAKIRIAFGGGAAYKPANERMWSVLAGHHFDAFLFLGDNVYIDAPKSRAYQRYKYYRRQSWPGYRAFVANTPIYAVWDDHDFGTDDCSGGPEVDQPAWKREVWTVFKQNWVNPAYGGGEQHPGSWFAFSIADVDFFLLDSRYYRTPPKSLPPAQRSMLGPVQKQWLLEKLQHSKATFKVIASPVPWAEGTKPGSLDTWDGFPWERDEIFQCIKDHRIGGVILLSADRHRHDIWKIERPGLYPLYEFESSKLTNVHTHKTMKQALFSWNGLGFAELELDTTAPDPELTHRIVNIDNQVVHEFKLKRSQLAASKQ